MGEDVKFESRSISTIDNAVAIARQHPDWIFRGHSRTIGDALLQPAVFRDDFNESIKGIAVPPTGIEAAFAFWFKHAAPSVYSACPPRDNYPAWLALMRHFGAPTRLLDWTESILIALYFATADDNADGQVIAMNGHNLAHRWVASRKVLVGPVSKALAHQAQVDMREWPAILQDKYHNLVAEPELLNYPLPFAPPLSFPRMANQLSYFTIHPDPAAGGKPLEKVLCEKTLKRYHVPNCAKPRLRRELVILGISERTLFPDLDGLSRYLLQKLDKWSMCEFDRERDHESDVQHISPAYSNPASCVATTR